MARVRDSLLPCESMGIKDYSDYVQDEWRPSTQAEINGQVSGVSVWSVLDKGSNTIKELVTPATLNQAYLRDWQNYDSGVLADIWVRTAASAPQEITYTGSPSITTVPATGVKTYAFSGGGGMNVHTYNGGGGTVENADYSSGYTVTYKVSSATQYTSPLYSKASNGSYYQNRQTFYTGYHKSTLSVTGTDTGTGSATLVFTPKSVAGGSVTITPYKPETVVRKVLQPASLTAEKTRDRNWGYYTRVPGSALEQVKTFLLQS